MCAPTLERSRTSARRSCAARPSRPRETCRSTSGPTPVGWALPSLPRSDLDLGPGAIPASCSSMPPLLSHTPPVLTRLSPQVNARSGAPSRAVAAPSPRLISARYMCAPTQASGPTPAPSPTVAAASPAPPTTRITCASTQVGQLACEDHPPEAPAPSTVGFRPETRPRLPAQSHSLLVIPGWARGGAGGPVAPAV